MSKKWISLEVIYDDGSILSLKPANINEMLTLIETLRDSRDRLERIVEFLRNERKT